MAITGWIFEDTDEGVEYREIGAEGDTTLEKRTVQRFMRSRILTNGDLPNTMQGGQSTSVISAGGVSSSGSYVCTSDNLKRKGSPGSGMKEQHQTWESYGSWENA